ncbi:MAG: inositol monophosphatase [Bacteroidetes bacterium]|nr:MAG: inositol monophosphatase [Bacteroidota bacterium]
MNLEIISKQAVNLIKSVGFFIHTESKKISAKDIEEKGFNDFVTYVDKEAEQKLINELRKIIPQAGFIVEEDQTQKRSSEFNWIIDPLDGTTNFIHALPVYSISVALSCQDEIIMGIVYELNSKECFHAIKDKPAFLNDTEISVSNTEELKNSFLAIGFPYNDFSHLDAYLSLFKDLMRKTTGIRRLGSAAVDLAYVACGRFDVFYEYGLKPWDVAAGSFIVQQAGGKVTDFGGKENYIFGREIIASNRLLHTPFLSELKNHFI